MNKAFPALAALLLCCACSGRGPQNDETVSPVQKIVGLNMIETQDGKASWRLVSPNAKVFEKTGKALLAHPQMEFLEKDEIVSRITAENGELLLETKDMVLSDNVVAHSLRDKTTLETTLLRYSSSRKKIFTEREVIITKDGGRMTGDNFEANPDLSEISLKNHHTLLPEKAP